MIIYLYIILYQKIFKYVWLINR
ncbi:unnamed protein product [Leptidea sinapis]|uniref:Uncharacterized protein n=1 Tax=Leptidea sinapis TaxID=189913 RepID=A0A5E4R4D0_9NEOP|nr:unnamed protein product [Leptidea sinapis]